MAPLPHRPCVCRCYAREHHDRPLVAFPEGSHDGQGGGVLDGHRSGLGYYVYVDRPLRRILAQARTAGLDEELAEFVHPRGVDRAAGSRRVPSVPGERGGTGVDRLEQVEARDGAPGTGTGVTVDCNEDHRAAVALGQPRSGNPDDAGMPLGRGQHVAGLGAGGRDLRLGFEAYAGLYVPPLRVQAVELLGATVGRLLVIGQQQLDGGVCPLHPSRCVEPWRQPESNRLLVNVGWVGLRDPHQRPEAGAPGCRQGLQALPGEPAVFPGEVDAVGDGRNGHQVEVGSLGLAYAGAGPEPRCELVNDCGSAEFGKRVTADDRMNDWGVRQLSVGARTVVVGHHHVDA